MRGFVVLSFLLVAAMAKPQYNYTPGPIGVPQVSFPSQPAVQQPGSSYIPPSHGGFTGGNGISSTPGHIGGGHGHGHPSSGFPSGNTGFPSGNTGFPSGNTGFPSGNTGFPSGNTGFPSGNTGFPSGGHVEEAPRHEAPLITKQFYLHSAPEDHDSIGKTKHFVLGRAQKNYRVVFIKAPSDSNANVRLSAEYAPQEEKTVIYVLSQKEHELDVNDIATPAPTQPSKPEVFFIKYKTPEEAAHAQREIQNQYDVLEGQSQVSDEGSAPLTSVIGALDKPVDNHALNTLGNQYLPTSH